MNRQLNPTDQATLFEIVKLGCPRATAAKYFGMTLDELQREMDRRAELAQGVLRAEAQAVVRHMQNIHNAAQAEKNWRTSAWWLDRHSDLAQRDDDGEAHLPRVVLAGLQRFAELIVAEITDVRRRHEIIQQLMAIAAGIAPAGTEAAPLAEALRLSPPVCQAAERRSGGAP